MVEREDRSDQLRWLADLWQGPFLRKDVAEVSFRINEEFGQKSGKACSHADSILKSWGAVEYSLKWEYQVNKPIKCQSV